MQGRWTLVALIASLALNLFLVGAGATVFVTGGPWRHAAPVQRSIPRRAARSLSPDHRAAFLAMLRREGQSVRDENHLARRLRLEAWGSLGDANFDPAAAKATLARANALNHASRAEVEAAIIDFAAPLPAPERAGFGQAMRQAILSKAAPEPRPAARRGASPGLTPGP